tara:strand:- start:167 stop:658 length:492 start_codon:yes stop_codon:yes gene_type:complete
MSILNKKNFSVLSFLLSSGLLMTALFIEYFYDLIPCELCLKQRWVHVSIICISLICIICLRFNKKFKAFYIPIIILWLSSGILAFYHFGIEQQFWSGFSECSANITFNKNTLNDILSRDPFGCNDVQFKFLNLSLAGWNALLSLTIFIFLFCILYLPKVRIYK